MATLQPYPKYKDSGVEWIGEIPENWNMIKLKYILEKIIDNRGKTPPLSDEGIPLLEINSLEGNSHYPDLTKVSKYITDQTYDSFLRDYLEVGDILFATVGSIGKIAIVPKNFHFAIAQNIVGFRINRCFGVSKYWLYTFISKYFYFTMIQYNKGNIQDSIKISNLIHAELIIPTTEEQYKVSSFLDNKLSNIDNLIINKESLIKLLEEKRQAIITETVTKGLDPNVNMKDSGIEWIGEIPEHWEEVKVGLVFEITLGKMIQTIKKNESDKLVPYLKANNVQDDFINFNNVNKMFANKNEINKYKLDAGDLLVCEGGEVGRSAFVQEDLGDTIFQNALHRVRGSDKGNIEYLHYLLVIIRNTKFIEILVNKATIAHFTRDKFSSLKIPLPNIKEQIEIVDYINKIKNDINSLQKNISFQIEKLREYRESLIYEAVTGKIDLRDYEVKNTNI